MAVFEEAYRLARMQGRLTDADVPVVLQHGEDLRKRMDHIFTVSMSREQDSPRQQLDDSQKPRLPPAISLPKRQRLADDLVFEILLMLGDDDLRRGAATCRQWRQLAARPALWTDRPLDLRPVTTLQAWREVQRRCRHSPHWLHAARVQVPSAGCVEVAKEILSSFGDRASVLDLRALPTSAVLDYLCLMFGQQRYPKSLWLPDVVAEAKSLTSRQMLKSFFTAWTLHSLIDEGIAGNAALL